MTDLNEPKHAKPALLSNKAYDTLMNTVLLALPALGTFYFTIAQFWGLPYAEEVVGTLAALAILVGVILKVSKSSYIASEAQKDSSQ